MITMTPRFSPVVKADARFSGSKKWLHVNVWFRDKNEIDNLIHALTELRDTVGDDFDHVHLQHHAEAPGWPIGLAEVNFFRPGRPADEIEIQMTEEAAKWLAEVRNDPG